MTPTRIIIYPKDVQRITGKSERYGRDILCKIKTAKGKQRHQYVTVTEFADFTGLPEELIFTYLD
jgi:hypothetical protein